MDLPLSRAVAEHLELVPEIGSTNSELITRASAGDEPDFAVLATTSQTAGKGRLGRVWVAPPGRTIAVSVLLRPRVSQANGPDVAPLEQLGWLPLLAGLAMTRAVKSLAVASAVTLKWPNDVHIDGLKVSGLLAEFVPAIQSVVIGAGLNLTMTSDELPTAASTSLTLHGVSEAGIVDVALAAYLAQLHTLYTAFTAARFDAAASGLAAAVSVSCATLGRRVRVELPGGTDMYGTAESLDEVGRLVVLRDSDGVLQPISAGDVTHLRYE